MSTDQTACADGDTAACDKLADDQNDLATAMTALGTSVYTTSGYLNGAAGKPGLADGLSTLADGSRCPPAWGSSPTGTGKLADGATTAATRAA